MDKTTIEKTELTAEQMADFEAYFRDLQADGRREGYEVDRETELQTWTDRVAAEAAA